MTAQNHEKFADLYLSIDWESEIGSLDCPSEMVKRLHEITIDATDKCFPLKTRRVRSTDDPWITDEIKRAIRTRKRRYKKWDRGPKWQSAKDHTNSLIKESKRDFYNDAVERLKARGSSQLPYKALKELAIPDRPPSWTINSLRPHSTNEALAEELADYFVRITDEFVGLDPDLAPTTFPSPFPTLMPHEVAERIRSGKKPKSAVLGDVLPSLASKFSDATAIPATRIINYCLALHKWPARWRDETQSAIPKCDSATNFDQLRNLSCTNSLSKVLESYVLDKLREEIRFRNNQFGGIKGSGTAHFLIECWDQILWSIDRRFHHINRFQQSIQPDGPPGVR